MINPGYQAQSPNNFERENKQSIERSKNRAKRPHAWRRKPKRVTGQATKGARWMPWRREPMKDVASCEKPRGAASKHRSGDIRMGQPSRCNDRLLLAEYIGQVEGTRGTETSKYPQEEKENSIPPVAASEKGRAQTRHSTDCYE